MAPTRSKKRKSNESQTSVDATSFLAPVEHTAIAKSQTTSRTPISRSPIKKAARGITVNQKQALIDNLQLEITERARKLRAQYNLQAQGLRTRIEMRVNRIPTSLRKANMGDLFQKYSENVVMHQKAIAEKSTSASAQAIIMSPSRSAMQKAQGHGQNGPPPLRPAKRPSDEMNDKENEELENPKKRLRAPVAPARTTSRGKLQPDQVLSPRSANSRTVPRSPVRPLLSPGKSYLARPISPLKPMAPTTAGGAASILTNMVEKAKSTRATAAAVGKAKKTTAVAPVSKMRKGRMSNSSVSSSTSSATTVVTKNAAAKKGTSTRSVMSAIKGLSGTASKKAPASNAVPTRVLRKRN